MIKFLVGMIVALAFMLIMLGAWIWLGACEGVTHREVRDAVRAGTSEIRNWIEGQGEAIEARLDQIEEKFDRVEEKVDRVEEKFDRVEEKFDRVEENFDRVEENFDRIERKIDKLIRLATPKLPDGLKVVE